MREYSVSQLAKLAHISVRTLHYYDEIGLLCPSGRTDSGYRQYDTEDLLSLQQILFYRELGLPLKEIRMILEKEDFNLIEALEHHRQGLTARIERLQKLVSTVDQTIVDIMEGKMTLSDEELFAAFTPEQAKRYRDEASEIWGEDRVKETERKLKSLSQDKWQTIQEEGRLVAEALAALMGRDASDAEVQEQIARHHAWIENFYPAPAEVYVGLAEMYVEHPEFRAYYDQFAPGLADFMLDAMRVYSEAHLR